MSKCPNCSCWLKNEFKCDICGHVIKEEAKKKKGISRKSDKQKEVTAEDLEFFKSIWEERPHRCEVSGKLLKEFSPYFFSHVLTKQAYPSFRYNRKNIVLCTPFWHDKWEFTDRRQRELQFVVLLEELLKQEYYQSKQIKRL